MPIRINLFAEAQAIEDLRRRDPVKRAIWLGCLLVAGMLVWSFSIYVQTLIAKSSLGQVETEITRRTNDFAIISANQRKTEDVRKKLASLRLLTTSRFLQGDLLNALQQVTLDDVQLMRLKVEQQYIATEETKGKTNSEGRVTPGKPASVRENLAVVLDARDSSSISGDRVNKFKDALSTNAYFQSVLSKTNGVRLTFVSPPTSLPDSKPFVLFTVECRYPERTR